MKVFSNTTPLIALSAINQLELLPCLFEQIYLTNEVMGECAAGGRIFVPSLHELSWVIPTEFRPSFTPHILLELDLGEKATILAAQEHHADLVLIDEKLGRNVAEYLGLQVSGTLGVLLKAKRENLIPSFMQAANSMREHGIFFHPKLIERLAITVGE
jgi:predicted nucleic acid-binding protein